MVTALLSRRTSRALQLSTFTGDLTGRVRAGQLDNRHATESIPTFPCRVFGRPMRLFHSTASTASGSCASARADLAGRLPGRGSVMGVQG